MTEPSGEQTFFSSHMSWYFLQCPCVAIGVAEVNILHAIHIDHLAHFNTPARERFAGLVDAHYDQVQRLVRSRLHF